MFGKLYWTMAAAATAVAILWASMASAGPIDPGFDLFHTDSGIIEIPSLGLGPTALEGVTAGPGNADTIVSRTTSLPDGGTGTIDVEIVALQLKSVAPVNLGGTTFDLDISLTSSVDGEYNVLAHNHNAADSYNSFFDVFVEIDFTKISGTGSNFTLTQELIMNASDVPWSHDPPPFYPLNPLFPSGGFYSDAVIYDGGNSTVNLALNLVTAISEPGTLAILGFGLAGLGYMRRRRAA